MKKWYVITVLLLVALLLAACTDPRPSNEGTANAPLPSLNQNDTGSAAVGGETGPVGNDPQTADSAPTTPADPTVPAEESELIEVTVTAEGIIGMLGDD